MDALQELIESDPGYTERITGYPPGPADAQSLLMMRPEGLPEEAKVVLGAFVTNLVAVVDLLRGYPNDHTAFIGLLEVHWNHQGTRSRQSDVREVQRYVETSWPEVGRSGWRSWTPMPIRPTGSGAAGVHADR